MSENRFEFANTVDEYMTAKEARARHPEAYAAMDNSLFKVGNLARNIKTGHIGPIQRITYSMDKVQYYHGNNPCRDEDLEFFVMYKRRTLSPSVPVNPTVYK